MPMNRLLRSTGALVPRPRRLRPFMIDCDLVSECWWRARRPVSSTLRRVGTRVH